MTLEEIKEQGRVAAFQVEFAVMMLNCGRLDEANTSFAKAIEAAKTIETLEQVTA